MSKLLIIDDDPIYQSTAQLILSKNMLFDDCTSYTDAKLALNYLIVQRHHRDALPDVIFVNLNMPGMGGWNFLCLHEDLLPFLAKKIDVFIVTSSDDRKDELRSQAYPFVKGFYSKPLNLTELLDISNYVTATAMKYDYLKQLATVQSDSLAELSNQAEVQKE